MVMRGRTCLDPALCPCNRRDFSKNNLNRTVLDTSTMGSGLEITDPNMSLRRELIVSYLLDRIEMHTIE